LKRAHSPPFSRRGGCASIKRSRSSAAQTGWLVNSNKNLRCATRIFIRRLRDILLTTPSAPLKERDPLLMSQPPLLENGGEWTRLATNPSPPPRVATCRTVLITNQFSIFIRGLQFIG